MARPLRIELPGAAQNMASLGNRREQICVGDGDRRALLGVLAPGLKRFGRCALVGARWSARAGRGYRRSDMLGQIPISLHKLVSCLVLKQRR
jgi:hypothetical protein